MLAQDGSILSRNRTVPETPSVPMDYSFWGDECSGWNLGGAGRVTLSLGFLDGILLFDEVSVKGQVSISLPSLDGGKASRQPD